MVINESGELIEKRFLCKIGFHKMKYTYHLYDVNSPPAFAKYGYCIYCHHFKMKIYEVFNRIQSEEYKT